jgi:hypothetical protein
MSDTPLDRLAAQAAALPNGGPLHPTELLGLPDGLREFVLWLVRQREVGPAQVAAHLGQPDADAGPLLAALAARELLRSAGGDAGRYRPNMTGRR